MDPILATAYKALNRINRSLATASAARVSYAAFDPTADRQIVAVVKWPGWVSYGNANVPLWFTHTIYDGDAVVN